MATEARSRLGSVAGWMGPLALIAVLIALFALLDPIGSLREVPAVETVAFERVVLDPGEITLSIRNDGPDELTIAQVLVNAVYWEFSISRPTLGRLETAKIEIPYPWDEGQPVAIALITSTGVVLEHDIEAAAETPDPGGSSLLVYSLLGLYIGVVPIAVGLLWLPQLRRSSDRVMAFVLAFTVGLLVFLLVDTLVEGTELALETAGVLDGFGLMAIGALVAIVGLSWLSGRGGNKTSGATLALLIAAGVGLHNLGEGLAVGAALAGGEFGLGTGLVIGFALHNTTEGLAIVAPFGTDSDRPSMGRLCFLGAVAGVPTIIGAWGGGYAFTPALGTLAFGLAAGAIAQVAWVIWTATLKGRADRSSPAALGFLAGLIVMYVTGLAVA